MASAAPVYATPEDIAGCGVPAAALAKLDASAILTALAQASRQADTYIATRYQLPLVSWGDDLKQIVCIIAAYRLLTYRGWQPNDPGNIGVTTLYNQALKTLRDVATGNATLSVVDTAPEPAIQPDVASDSPRGW